MATAAPRQSPEQQVAVIYSSLARVWGRQHWWPAQSRFEVIVGAFLTQNTSWANVELAMRQLRSARVLNLSGVRNVPLPRLEQLIRSSGYFRQKASRLKRFISFLDKSYGGSLTKMFAQPTSRLREQLLSLNGVGPETADSILLYAGQHASFVVDAYTKRIAERHGILPAAARYEGVRALFQRGLAAVESQDLITAAEHPGAASHKPSRMSLASRSPLAQVYNEMHGLLVGVGKKYCLKSAPKCEGCPLNHLLSGNDNNRRDQVRQHRPRSPFNSREYN
jgi:endonuclease-3 related protein